MHRHVWALAPAHQKGFAVTGTTRWHNAFRPLRAAPPDTESSDDQPTSRLASARSDASASVEAAADNGPGAFRGPFVSGAQAVAVLSAYIAAFLGLSALLLRRRDVV